MSKNPAAVALGKLGGKAGTGAAKVRSTSFSSESAKAALAARWAKGKRKPKRVAVRSNEKVSDASDAFAAPLGSSVRSTTYKQSEEM